MRTFDGWFDKLRCKYLPHLLRLWTESTKRLNGALPVVLGLPVDMAPGGLTSVHTVSGFWSLYKEVKHCMSSHPLGQVGTTWTSMVHEALSHKLGADPPGFVEHLESDPPCWARTKIMDLWNPTGLPTRKTWRILGEPTKICRVKFS